MFEPGAAYLARRSWYFRTKSALGSNAFPPNACRDRLYIKPNQSRSGETDAKVLDAGVFQAPSGVGLLSGAICRLNATKHTITQPQTSARIDRPANSTGRSKFTAFLLIASVKARKIANVNANKTHKTMKSSR